MSKFTQLVKLVRKGEYEQLREILHSENVSINEIDPKSGKGLLHMAIENSDIDTFNVLVQSPGINLEQPAKDGENPLEMAVRLNDAFLVNRLLELKANIRKRNKEGETVIYTAIRNQTNKDIIKKLFQHVDINEKIDNYGSYLNLAVTAKQNENFYYLIQEFGIKYQIKDDEDNTCLLLAVRQNKGDYVVAILDKLQKDPILTPIEKQFFFNAQNREGNTALHEASLKDYQTITQKLEIYGQKFGFDWTLKNKKGQTIQLIKQSLEKNRLSEIQLEKKRQEERVVRRREKEQEKIRLRQEEERQLIEQKRKRKEQQERLQIETAVKTANQKQKTLWIAVILIIAALAGMYLVLTNAIEKKKVPSF